MRPTLSHALRRAAPETPDGRLLDLFARHRDEEAFAAVVRRHGPMVLGVCRRLLGNRADADDAFQATFLVLARRAPTLGRVEALAGWLHGVAVNAARKLRHMNARRRARERRAAGPTPLPADDLVRDELLAALDAEIARLPAAYRDAVVLCDLEGATRKDAARRLGCPEGTVAGRLARARSLLAKRLTDRGLVFAGLTGLTITVPPALLASAIEAATAGPTSARVAAATEGVMKAMLLTKIRAATAVLVIGALALTGIGVSRGPADEKPAPVPAAPESAKPGDRRVTAFPLKKVMVGEAIAALSKTLAGGRSRPGDTDRLIEGGFRAADRNGDGRISLDETDGLLKRVFAEYDRNSDGLIDPDEYRALMKARLVDPGALVTRGPSVNAVTAGSATLIAIEADNTLLVHADEATTREVEAVLRKLGEPAPKVATVLTLKNISATEAAGVLTPVFGRARATFAPLPGDRALVAYATEADLRVVRQLLGRAIDAPATKPAPAVKPVPVPGPPPAPAAGRFPVELQDQPWEKVFEWYAKVSGLTCLAETRPTGTFTYHTPPGMTYTVAEITDVLNDALQARKFILIRREQSFGVYPADEKVPPDVIPRVSPEDLNRRGRTELVQVMLPLTASREFNATLLKLLKGEPGPFGAAEAFGPDHVLVTDTAGRARQLRNLLADVNARVKNGGLPAERALTIPLKNALAADVAGEIRKHVHPALKVAVSSNTATNSVKLDGDPVGVAMLADMVRKLDAPPHTLAVLPLRRASARVVIQVIQTVFAMPDRVWVSYDGTANSLVVHWASPADLQRIKDLVAVLDAPPPAEPREKLVADVEELRDRVAYAERMVKLGYMAASQLQAERDKLAAAEAKLKGSK